MSLIFPAPPEIFSTLDSVKLTSPRSSRPIRRHIDSVNVCGPGHKNMDRTQVFSSDTQDYTCEADVERQWTKTRQNRNVRSGDDKK